MESLKSTEIADGRIVFGQMALQAALENGEVESEYMSAIQAQQRREAVTEAVDGAKQAIVGFIATTAANVKLEARMAVFDAFHGTNYRQIRHDLIREQKLAKFEKSIGLSRVK